MTSVKEILKEITVVDVRTQAEFQQGHVTGAINIPLKDIPRKIEEIRNLRGQVVLCCASGNRSGQAQQFLSAHGVECVNGGSWLTVNEEITGRS